MSSVSPRPVQASAPNLGIDSSDTTSSVLSRNPEAWEQIAANPSLIAAAVVEAVRLASPIRGFTRCLSRDHEIGGVAAATRGTGGRF